MNDDVMQFSDIDEASRDDVERQGLAVNRRNLAVGQVVSGIVADLEAMNAFGEVDVAIVVVGVMSALANSMATQSGLPHREVVEIAATMLREQAEIDEERSLDMGTAVVEAMFNKRNGRVPFKIGIYDPVGRRRLVQEISIIAIEESRTSDDRFVWTLTDHGLLALIGMLDTKEDADVRFVDTAIRRAIERGHYGEAIAACVRQRRELDRTMRTLTKAIDSLRRGADLTWDTVFGRSITEIGEEIQDSIDRTLELGRYLTARIGDPALQPDTRRKLVQARQAVEDLHSMYSRIGPKVAGIHDDFSAIKFERLGVVRQALTTADIGTAILAPMMDLTMGEAQGFTHRHHAHLLPSARPSVLDFGGLFDKLWGQIAADAQAEFLELQLQGQGGEPPDPEPDSTDDGFEDADPFKVVRMGTILERVVRRLGPDFDMQTLLDACDADRSVEPDDRPLIHRLAWTWKGKIEKDGKRRLVDADYERTGTDGTFRTDDLVGENVTFRRLSAEDQAKMDEKGRVP